MSELSARIGLSMNLSNLDKLLCCVITNKHSGTFGQKEEIVLSLQEFGNLFVLLEEARLDGILETEAEAADVVNDLLSLLDDGFLLVEFQHRLPLFWEC